MEKYKSSVSLKSFEVDKETGEMLLSDKHRFKYMTYFDTGNSSTVMHFSTIKSGHYHIAYKIDMNRDYIDVNVSLPKYFHGTNVFQLIPHLFDKNYSRFLLSENITDVSGISFKLFYALFKNFLKREFPTTSIDLVEIVRLDFCYNQVFNTEEDCLIYFKNIQTKRKQYQRDKVNEAINYESSLSYVTSDYSFKVYHKGTEFRKHDSKELKKFNDSVKRHYFNIPVIDDLAGRTLRYELTSRLANLNYVYKFRYLLKTIEWEFKYANWLDYGRYPEKLKSKSQDERRHIKRDIKQVKDLINRSMPMVFTKSLKTDNYIKLNETTFSLYIDYFTKMVNDYQLRNDQSKVVDLRTLCESPDFNQLVVDYGYFKQKPKSKISKTKLILLMHLLESNTMDEIRTKGLFPNSTYYVYLNFLKRFGINKDSHFGIAINASLDFKRYYEYCTFNGNSLKNLKLYPV